VPRPANVSGYFVPRPGHPPREWREIQQNIKTQPAATCVFEEPDLIARTVRDFLTEDVERIVVDNNRACERMREMIAKISKRSVDKVKLYAESQPVFDRFNITRQLENTFSRQVHLKGGGYLVIDETEALVAIDVNTGRHKSGKDQGPDHPQSQPGVGGGNLPSTSPPQHGVAHRAGFHRHEIPPRPAAGLSTGQGRLRRGQGQDPHSADFSRSG